MTKPVTRGRRGRLLRIVICLMSMGFVFPSALMERADEAKLAAEEQLKAAAKASANSASGS
jgi:hypothetical protein